MASTERRRDRALERAARDVRRVMTDVRTTRRASGLSVREAAASVGPDPTTFGRLERSELQHPTVDHLAIACAAGLELAVRDYLVGEPVRDAGQLGLLGRFRARISAELPWGAVHREPRPSAEGHPRGDFDVERA